MLRFSFGPQAPPWDMLLAYALAFSGIAALLLLSWYSAVRTIDELPPALRPNWPRRAMLMLSLALTGALLLWSWQRHNEFTEMRMQATHVELDFALPRRTLHIPDTQLALITAGYASKGDRAGIVVCTADRRCWRSQAVGRRERCTVWKALAADPRLQGVQPALCR